MSAASCDPRTAALDRAWRLSLATVGWNLVEGVVAVGAGTAAESIALLGFGIDSFIETASAVVAAWRVRQEQRGADGEAVEQVERRTARICGVLLLLLAGYLLIDAGRRLIAPPSYARESPVGMVLTAVSLVVMPVLGTAKLRVARALSSATIRADAFETITCAWLSLATLLGLLLNAILGWWWADPASALLLVPLIAREGLEALRGRCHCG
ncbi:MAG: cation transporter [Planctomycetes bacterium]|nr:cation transporter [Planctomycetota bacterium]